MTSPTPAGSGDSVIKTESDTGSNTTSSTGKHPASPSVKTNVNVPSVYSDVHVLIHIRKLFFGGFLQLLSNQNLV